MKPLAPAGSMLTAAASPFGVARSAELHVAYRDETATVAVAANTVFWRWHRVGSTAAMRRVLAEATALGKTYPQAVGLVHLVAGAPGKMPDDADRERIVRSRRELRPYVRASVLVFEGDSILSAIIRSVTTAVILASGDKRPLRVFGETRAAARWLSKQWDPILLDETSLEMAMEAVKAVTPRSA